MKKHILVLLLTVICIPAVNAQYAYKVEGKCGFDVKWSFDGNTL